MPLLQLDTTYDLTEQERRNCTKMLTQLYVEEMETTAGHVAVVVRSHPAESLSIGRAVDGPLAFLDADIRSGRSFEMKRSFGLAAMNYLHAEWDVPEPNLKVAFTEHPGEQLMGVDRVGGDWTSDDTT
ncbi:tautomerase [Halorubraceae archaeon YAN]|nr:tautomerase [Halorubraceae archaeon YAN]